ncbi:hypothetical protein [uncultured Alistipes sp.]|jgi:hypothetical protein|uniref:hypothetical protein n=1 Tax=uncultured Alistipes sp. TaxID=538949 RepID=UPI0025CF26D5|nr:hypothetical protein [uncultured Alistipes sp.]
MRKIIIILIGLLGYMACFPGTDVVCAYAGGHDGVAILAGASGDEVWRCEREYNADMNLPRILGEVTSSPVVPVVLRCCHPEQGQTADRYAADRVGAGVVKAAFEFKSSDLSVGLYAVDYYVYRLRRLII